eukprot:CAMPEP_0206623576 /NCGR_PEP_ID=MMETSP0325_2-20121206/63559_1 /ASSEMBLY_ACC=CAM_ASM_000347 /TAXON_ID=2866 /ORGANISM="Crypthecodinium cohnii, Strain Seligo" /LENGTH=32 /DNA_ID= /DNA_START= /DNA_END= /DNA_ORIENTATION=
MSAEGSAAKVGVHEAPECDDMIEGGSDEACKC